MTTTILVAVGLLVGLPLLLWLYSRTLPRPDRAFLGFRNSLAGLIERRMGGYRQSHTVPDPTVPDRLTEPFRVAVIGGGLGGIGAATTLAERGAGVVVFDKNPYFGGKIAAWEEATSDGSVQKVAHGFHAFFRNYYNLNDFLRRIGIHQTFTSLDDYQVLSAEGEPAQLPRTSTPLPYSTSCRSPTRASSRWSDILTTQAIHEMDRFLLYDETTTFEQLDHVPFDRFAERAELPKSLMLSFNSFSRAFFADPDRLSTAELIKSFHFYYLSQDAGLIYDLPDDWFGDALIAPSSLTSRTTASTSGCRLRSRVWSATARPSSSTTRRSMRWSWRPTWWERPSSHMAPGSTTRPIPLRSCGG